MKMKGWVWVVSGLAGIEPRLFLACRHAQPRAFDVNMGIRGCQEEDAKEARGLYGLPE